MANETPFTIFLAGSTVEVVSALACIAGLGIREAIVFVERNVSFTTAAMDPLLKAARERFSTVRFVELNIERSTLKTPVRAGWQPFVRRCNAARSVKKQLDKACREDCDMDLKTFGARIQTVYFTALHDYVMVFLTACPQAARVFYPHGFDHPRRQQVRDCPYLLRRRSVRTMIATLAQQRKHIGPGGLALGILGRLFPRMASVSLPFMGVDRVLTFRRATNYVPNETVQVPGLKEVFQWLLGLPPWKELLLQRKTKPQAGSLLLLLSEYDYHPIWEQNRNYGASHLQLLQRVSQLTGLNRIVIKAHVRSDGFAAEWLADFLKEHERKWRMEILPLALSGLPVEALALTGEFAAACSLGSYSLPPDLGFGVPHYVSPVASALFDGGWVGKPFWARYADGARMLVDEGICRDVDNELPKVVDSGVKLSTA